MDDRGFDNIARRLGTLRSRRSALKTAGCGTVAAVFAALGLDNSALAQVTTQDHCKTLQRPCDRARECCGFRKGSSEIRCKTITGLSGERCCGQAKASCNEDRDCCQDFECNMTTLRCQRA